MSYYLVKELYGICSLKNEEEIKKINDIVLDGWIKTNRDNGNVCFIELNDGSYFKNIQIVYTPELKNHNEVVKLLTGSSIEVKGKFVYTPNAKQDFEIQANEINIIGAADESYPLQKKRHSFEFLREIPHIRPRANTFMAVFRLRSILSMAIHQFFQDKGFVYVHTPIITGNDAEGAGEVFTATTIENNKYEEDFFGKRAALTVSGQLHVEAFAMAFRNVYTFGPTFRAENSNTKTHASEFWMIEPELAFADLKDDMNIIEELIKYCIDYCLKNAKEEMDFFNNMIDKTLLERLNKVKNSEFKRMTYTEAVDILLKADQKFENKVEWGIDFNTEHERYICEKVVKGPVFLTDYPKDIKAFYMRLNDDNKTVAACDLLVPFVGELVGGSQREERLDYLEKRMSELNMEKEILDWYLDLRRYGGCKHAGFGVGFERLMMYLTGMDNIRDVLPYPRTPGNLNL